MLAKGNLSTQSPNLRDSIKEGKIRLASLSVQAFVDGRSHPYGIAKNLQAELPLEVWFMDSWNFLVVLRWDRIRSLYGIETGPQYELLAGLHPDDKDFPREAAVLLPVLLTPGSATASLFQ